GPVLALNSLDLEIGQGITGLVGANGAGKSTLLKILLGLVPATSGRAHVMGHDIATEGPAIRSAVGYLPEHDCLPPDVSASDFVVHMAMMSGLPRVAARERAAEVLRHVGLAEERYRPMGGYSTGMKQKAKLAQSLAHDPRLVLLDEPTNGLHLADVANLLGLLDRLVDSGLSVVVIEHHQAVMAHADWIIDLGPGAGHDGGKVVFEGTPTDLVAARSTLTGEHLAAYVGA
ncbi:ABC transporter, partial [Salmonella enterica subsp. enterica serovar Javiana]